MKADKRLVVSLLDVASYRICCRDKCERLAEATASAYIEGLLTIVRNPELAFVLREVPDAVTKCCDSIEAALADNSGLERQSRSLRTAAELVIGSMNKKVDTED